MQLASRNSATSCSFSARRWDLTEPRRNCRKDLSRAVTYHRRNYTRCTKQKHRRGLQQVQGCIANCSCLLYNIPITRSDIYTLPESLPFPYGKSVLKCFRMAKTTFFQHRFQKVILSLTEMLTTLAIFLKSPYPWIPVITWKKSNCSYKKKKPRNLHRDRENIFSINKKIHALATSSRVHTGREQLRCEHCHVARERNRARSQRYHTRLI